MPALCRTLRLASTSACPIPRRRHAFRTPTEQHRELGVGLSVDAVEHLADNLVAVPGDDPKRPVVGRIGTEARECLFRAVDGAPVVAEGLYLEFPDGAQVGLARRADL